MTEKIFESKFHKWYVGGEGVIVEKPFVDIRQERLPVIDYESILSFYRMYVNDPKAELPGEILEKLKSYGKI